MDDLFFDLVLIANDFNNKEKNIMNEVNTNSQDNTIRKAKWPILMIKFELMLHKQWLLYPLPIN